MRKLLQQRNAILESNRSNEIKFDENLDKIERKIKPIIDIMSAIEVKVVDSYQDRLNQKDIYDCYLMKSGSRSIISIRPINNIHSIKIEAGMIKIETVKYYYGENDIVRIKIPEIYLSLTKSEIEEIHTEWAIKTMEKLIDKNLKRKTANIKAQIEKLQSQL